MPFHFFARVCDAFQICRVAMRLAARPHDSVMFELAVLINELKPNIHPATFTNFWSNPWGTLLVPSVCVDRACRTAR
eukprot:COSAG02_NODE_7822_length_2833_cov_2.297366_2_plen_77_part_00